MVTNCHDKIMVKGFCAYKSRTVRAKEPSSYGVCNELIYKYNRIGCYMCGVG